MYILTILIIVAINVLVFVKIVAVFLMDSYKCMRFFFASSAILLLLTKSSEITFDRNALVRLQRQEEMVDAEVAVVFDPLFEMRTVIDVIGHGNDADRGVPGVATAVRAHGSIVHDRVDLMGRDTAGEVEGCARRHRSYIFRRGC